MDQSKLQFKLRALLGATSIFALSFGLGWAVVRNEPAEVRSATFRIGVVASLVLLGLVVSGGPPVWLVVNRTPRRPLLDDAGVYFGQNKRRHRLSLVSSLLFVAVLGLIAAALGARFVDAR